MNYKSEIAREDLDTEIEKTCSSLLSELQSQFIDFHDSQDPTNKIDQIISLLDKFQESPQLLDRKIELFLTPLPQSLLDSTDPEYARLLYCFTKVRGYKVISKFFMNDVHLIDNIYQRWISAETWEGRYIFGLWLSMLVLVPFELTAISSTLAQDIYTNALEKLHQPGKESFSASLILSRMLGRSDMRDEMLPHFLAVCTDSQLRNSDVFFTAGILQTLAKVLKTVSSETILPYSNTIFSVTTDIMDKYDDTRIRKLAIKVGSRLSLLLLSTAKEVIPEVVEMCISSTLNQLGDHDTVTRCSSAKEVANMSASLPMFSCDEVIEELFRLFLVDTSVKKTTDELYDVDFVSVDEWHGLTFCLAEFLRRALIKKEGLSKNLERILKTALTFEQLNVNHSLGGAVRDAGAYACWSLVRSYRDPPVDLIVGILRTLVCVACFDREINMRRAAAAAVQECIGRQSGNLEGTISVANGLKLVETLDFFKVSNRDRAYLEVAAAVSLIKGDNEEHKPEEFIFLDSLVHHLFTFSIRSFDVTVRRLGSKSLGKLMKNCSNKTRKVLIDQLINDIFASLNTSRVDIFHGTGCALAQVLLSCGVPEESNVEQGVNELFFSLCKLSDESHYANHLTCLVAEATTELVTATVKLGIMSTNELLNRIFGVIIKGVEDPTVLGLIRNLIRQFGVLEPNHQTNRYSLLPETLDNWKSRVKSGNAEFTVLISETCGSFNDKNDRISWTEGIVKFLSLQYRDALSIDQKVAIVRGLSDIIKDWAEYTSEEDHCCPFDEWLCNQVSEIIKVSLDDYSTDPRGDIGSWLRTAGMTCAESLLGCFGEKFTNESSSCVDWDLIWRELRLRCLRIAGEKLDRLRVQAFRVGIIGVKNLKLKSCMIGDEDDDNNKGVFEGLCQIIEADPKDEQQVRYILTGLVMAVAGGGTSDVFTSSLSLPMPRASRSSKSKGNSPPIFIVAAKSVYTCAHGCFCEEFLPNCTKEVFSMCCKVLCIILGYGEANSRVIIPALKVWTSILDRPEIYSRLEKCGEGIMRELYDGVSKLINDNNWGKKNVQLQVSCLGVFAGMACLNMGYSSYAKRELDSRSNRALLKPVRQAANELKVIVELQVSTTA